VTTERTTRASQRQRLSALTLYRPLPRAAGIGIGLALVTVISLVDWLTPDTTQLSVLYVGAITIAAWAGPVFSGYAVAAASTIAMFAVATLAHSQPTETLLTNGLVATVVFAATAVAVTTMRRSIDDGRHDALIDPLTETLNRRGFDTVAERERIRAGREGQALTLAYFDLDSFKQVNDAFGHKVGDTVLNEFATTISTAVRGTDILARVGGDEFVLLLPNTDARQALVVVDRIRNRLRESVKVGNASVTASVGVATYRFPPESIDALVFGADDLMYEAKQRGGDSVVGQVVIGSARPWEDVDASDDARFSLTRSA